MSAKVTMQELADRIGCSKSQVSRAINGQPDVAPEIRRRILELAAHCQYRNLARNHLPTIAMIIPQRIDGFTLSLIEACLAEAERRSWGCLVLDARQCVRLHEHCIDGVISTLFDRDWPQRWGELKNLPMVTINNYGYQPDHIPSIDPDTFAEARAVLEHLKSLGHRRIARIHVEEPEHAYHRGSREFLSVAAELGLLPDTENIDTAGPLSPEFFLQLLKQGFTALYIIHQYLAVRAAHALAQTGVKIPGEVSLITYELPGVSAYLNPPHTTLGFDYAGLVKTSFDQLTLRMKLQSNVSDAVPKIPVVLTVRGTSAPPPGHIMDCASTSA